MSWSTINHFRLICAHHRTGHVRAVATAAIRNATNREHICFIASKPKAGLPIELISGEQEASYGFLGMINSMDIKDGFLIDIGGGSTEVSVFKDRTLVQAVSFPFGCVSFTRRFLPKASLSDRSCRRLSNSSKEAAAASLAEMVSGLPLVGVGGTIRAFGQSTSGGHTSTRSRATTTTP